MQFLIISFFVVLACLILAYRLLPKPYIFLIGQWLFSRQRKPLNLQQKTHLFDPCHKSCGSCVLPCSTPKTSIINFKK